MKLLLTSNGLSNKTIGTKLFELVGKSPQDTSIAFIPTAMNLAGGDKTWFVNDLTRINSQYLKSFDIVEFAAMPKDEWLPRLEIADVIFFSGGDTNYLLKKMHEHGLYELMPALMKTRVYAGISAGSIITGSTISTSSDDVSLYYESDFKHRAEKGLDFVSFLFRPHYNSPQFPNAKKDKMQAVANHTGVKVYAVDDESAIAVNGDSVEIVSEGTVEIIKPASA